jgi:cardiolipin synthase
MISPNQLTVLRMAFVPMLVLLMVYRLDVWALIVFLAAAVTDMLDGLIARRRGQKTLTGTLLDPLADKLLLVSAFTVLSSASLNLTVRIPLWLTITVIGRDLLLVCGVLIFNLTIGRRAFPPSTLGKSTTVAQLFLVMTVLVGNALGFVLPGFVPLIYLTLILTVASGVHYMFQGMTLIGRESVE